MGYEQAEDPIVLAHVQLFDGVEWTVETALHERFDIVRWLDNEHMLIFYGIPGQLAVLNVQTGELTGVGDFFAG